MLVPRQTHADRDACAYLQWVRQDVDARTSDCAAERRSRRLACWTALCGDRRRQLWTCEHLTSLIGGVGAHAGDRFVCDRRRQLCPVDA